MKIMKKILQTLVMYSLLICMSVQAHDNIIMKITSASLDAAYQEYSHDACYAWYAQKGLQASQIVFMSCVVLSFALYGAGYSSEIDQEKKDLELKKYSQYQLMSAMIASHENYQKFDEFKKTKCLWQQYESTLIDLNHFVTGFGVALAGSIGGTLLANYFEDNVAKLVYEQSLEGYVHNQTHILPTCSYFMHKSEIQNLSSQVVITKINQLVADIHKFFACVSYQLKYRSDIQDWQQLEDDMYDAITLINNDIDCIVGCLDDQDCQSEKMSDLILNLSLHTHAVVQDFIFVMS